MFGFPKIKICGITNHQDAQAAAELGVDALGFIFYHRSPRYITPESARKIISALPAFIATVGVFVNEELQRVKEIMDCCGINLAQLHGQETPGFCTQLNGRVIKTIHMQDKSSLIDLDRYPARAILLDTYSQAQPGGTGKTFNWELAVEAGKHARIILSGGLNPDNIAEAIRTVSPYGVDVSSGVEEEPGIKNPQKLREFVLRARECVVEGA